MPQSNGRGMFGLPGRSRTCASDVRSVVPEIPRARQILVARSGFEPLIFGL